MGFITIVPNFPIDRDLDTGSKATLIIMLRFQNHGLRLRFGNAQLSVDPVAFGFGAHLVESVSVGPVGADISGDAAGAGGDDVCGAGGSSVGGSREGEGAAVNEAAAHGEDDS